MREEMLPRLQNPGRFFDLIKKGGLYAYGRDKQMSPIVVINLRKSYDMGYSADEVAKAYEFL